MSDTTANTTRPRLKASASVPVSASISSGPQVLRPTREYGRSAACGTLKCATSNSSSGSANPENRRRNDCGNSALPEKSHPGGVKWTKEGTLVVPGQRKRLAYGGYAVDARKPCKVFA